MTHHLFLKPHGNLAWIRSVNEVVHKLLSNKWRKMWAQKARNLSNRPLPWATLKAKVAAHQPSAFRALSTSNYLGDHTFRKPWNIWFPIKLPCQGFSIFYLQPCVRLEPHLYFLRYCIMTLENMDQSFTQDLFQHHSRAAVARLHQSCENQNGILKPSSAHIKWFLD